MPRPMLKPVQNQGQSQNLLSATPPKQAQKKQMTQTEKMVMDRLLRKKRSKRYMDAIHSLDAGGHVHNQDKVNDIIDAIREEFPEVEINGVMLGIISKCYLGHSYEVHTLDVTGQIIEHYQTGQKMPGDLERARTIAMRGGYDFIEVYIDCLRCVSSNGTVSVVDG